MRENYTEVRRRKRNCPFLFKVNVANKASHATENLINIAYSILNTDDDSRFITKDEFIMTLRYLVGEGDRIPIIIRKNRTLSKYRISRGIQVLSDSPDTPDPYDRAKELATSLPVLMLIQETEHAAGWGNRPFWWPILVVQQDVIKTVYAARVAGEKIRF